MSHLRASTDTLSGKQLGDYRVKHCDDFSYTDPIDESITTQQGIRILFEDESRIVFRLSGTGTQGATLRVYIERYVTDSELHNLETQDALSALIEIANNVAEIKSRCKRELPDVIT